MFTTNHGRESAAADCLLSLRQIHRRSEFFVRQLAQAAEAADETELAESQRTALEVALQAFEEHTLSVTSEETELFACMRNESTLEMQRIYAKLDVLEEDFWMAQFYAGRVSRIGRHWLAQNHLTRSEYAVLCDTLVQILRLYQRHLKLEAEVFPLAERVMSAAA